MNDNSATPEPPPIGAVLGAVELLAQRVHVLERALIGMAAFATPEQRHAVQSMIDQAARDLHASFQAVAAGRAAEQADAQTDRRDLPGHVLGLTAMSETSTVTIEVLDVALTPRHGRLAGLAQVAITIDGVELIPQGVRLMRRADGLTGVEVPAYRHVDGDLAPAVVLPEELEEAVSRAVLNRASGRVAVLVGS